MLGPYLVNSTISPFFTDGFCSSVHELPFSDRNHLALLRPFLGDRIRQNNTATLHFFFQGLDEHLIAQWFYFHIYCVIT